MPAPPLPWLCVRGVSGEACRVIRSAITVNRRLRQAAPMPRAMRLKPYYIDQAGPLVASRPCRGGAGPGRAGHGCDLPGGSQRDGFQGAPRGSAGCEVCVPVLHGPNGEETQRSRACQADAGCRSWGSGVLASRWAGTSSDEGRLRRRRELTLQVPMRRFRPLSLRPNLKQLLGRLERQLGYPVSSKPHLGSSVGISKATDTPLPAGGPARGRPASIPVWWWSRVTAPGNHRMCGAPAKDRAGRPAAQVASVGGGDIDIEGRLVRLHSIGAARLIAARLPAGYTNDWRSRMPGGGAAGWPGRLFFSD